jgi:hypothetical protein
MGSAFACIYIYTITHEYTHGLQFPLYYSSIVFACSGLYVCSVVDCAAIVE